MAGDTTRDPQRRLPTVEPEVFRARFTLLRRADHAHLDRLFDAYPLPTPPLWTPLGNRGHNDQVTAKASSTARYDANSRLAHHRCSVDGCPCRIDFSRAA